jgi:CheY-like chemotaxis protein
LCQVLAALDEKVYDIILMDIHMPEMDGLEASQIIQQRFAPPDRPRIVALSADTLQVCAYATSASCSRSHTRNPAAASLVS